MFPVAVNCLSISQIADYWASEIAPGDTRLRERRESDIRDLLVSAWWLGELVGKARRTQLSFLTSLYTHWHDEIDFRLPGKYPRSIHKHAGGSRIWLTVPDVDPKNWTVDTCKPAFETLAIKWSRLRGNPDADPIIEATEPTDGYRVLAWEIEDNNITRDEFFRWTVSKQFELPKFWGAVSIELKRGEQLENAKSEAKTTRPNRRGRTPKVREKAYVAMTEDIESGKLSHDDLHNMKEVALAARYSVSRETARIARRKVLASNNVENSIPDK